MHRLGYRLHVAQCTGSFPIMPAVLTMSVQWCAVVGLAAAALPQPPAPPQPNVTQCELESCVVSPTDCGDRSECREAARGVY